MRGISIGLAVCLLGAALPRQNAVATQIEHRSPRQLAEESALVVRGTVAGVRSFWNARGTKIFTEATVEVDQTYQGRDSRSIRVVQIGGVVGHVRMAVAGALAWRRGEEVLLFLERYDDASFQVTGFSQGKYAIERDAATGRAFVRGAGELAGVPEGPAARPLATVSLETFIERALGRE